MSKTVMVIDDSGSFRRVVKVDGVDATEKLGQEKADLVTGVRTWVTKPFLPAQLVDAVDRLCV